MLDDDTELSRGLNSTLSQIPAGGRGALGFFFGYNYIDSYEVEPADLELGLQTHHGSGPKVCIVILLAWGTR